MSKIFVRQGNAAVSVSDEMERLVQQLLDADPIIKRAIEDEIEQVYQDAYRQWPVRVIPPKSADRRKEQTIYAIQQSGKTRQGCSRNRRRDDIQTAGGKDLSKEPGLKEQT